MLTFLGPADTSFTLSIEGYQFPEIPEDYDANWVNVAVRASVRKQRVHQQSPCLLSWDVMRLACWFQQIARQENPESDHFSGLENDLTFDLTGQNKGLFQFRITLQHGLLPVPTASEPCLEPIVVPVTVRADELEAAATALWSDVKRFPSRGQLGKQWVGILSQRGCSSPMKGTHSNGNCGE